MRNKRQLLKIIKSTCSVLICVFVFTLISDLVLIKNTDEKLKNLENEYAILTEKQEKNERVLLEVDNVDYALTYAREFLGYTEKDEEVYLAEK